MIYLLYKCDRVKDNRTLIGVATSPSKLKEIAKLYTDSLGENINANFQPTMDNSGLYICYENGIVHGYYCIESIDEDTFYINGI